jgi:GT2 family glycosyltransferase
MPAPPTPESFGRHEVTAVLVTHDGERWLRGTAAAIQSQRRPVQRLVAVDTGSTDSSREIVAQLLSEYVATADIVGLPPDTGYGTAVAEATRRLVRWSPDGRATDDRVEWLWLLHDDCEPAPDALQRLLAVADTDPAVAVVGPKVRGWYRRRMLLELGFTVTRGGRRETGLERGENDQGQHDDRREALAVGSAGMLVRRDVWEQLGGFDPALGLMRDDLDFCWRVWAAGHKVLVAPRAVVYHAEAAARERRSVSIGAGRVHLLDRVNAMRVLLANVRGRAVPLTVLRLAVGSLLYAAGFLLAKMPGRAVDELLATGVLLGRPGVVRQMRRSRRATRRVLSGAPRRLFPRSGHQLRQALDALTAVAGGAAAGGEAIGRHRASESGPTGDEVDNLDPAHAGLLHRGLRSPLGLLVLGLGAVALLAARSDLFGGRLMGGALLPAPDGASDLWESYVAAWHPVGVGSGSPAPAYLPVVALVATLLLGKASLAVSVLVIGAVPLAGLTAYVAVRPVVRSRSLRVWGAAAYALLPVMTGAVAAGRLGTTVAVVLLPLAALAGARTVGTPTRPGSVRAAWLTGLLLAVVTALVPIAFLVALLLAVVAVATLGRADRTLWRRLAIVVVTPLVLLVPWSWRLLTRPSLFLLEAGLPGPDLSDPDLAPWSVLLLTPGGPGDPLPWLGAGLLLAGLAALVRVTRREVVLAAWVVALVGFGVALAVSRLHVTAPTLSTAVPAWPGFPLAVAAAGLLLAAMVGADGATQRIASRSFGVAQPVAVLVAVLAAATPVVAAGWWAWHGVGGPLDRRDPVLLPAHVAAEGQTVDRPRTLVLRTTGEGRLSYALLRDQGPRLSDAETAPPRAGYARLDAVVADMASGRGGAQVPRLADYAVRYVLVSAPVDRALSRALDSLPGLVRVSAPGGDALWRLDVPVTRVRLVGKDGAVTPLPSGPVGARVDVPPSEGGRRLVLSEAAAAGWKATLDGQPLLPGLHDGWAQAFEVRSSTGGELVVRYEDAERTRWLLVQAVAVLTVVVLALPGGARRPEDEEEQPPASARRHARSESEPVAAAPDRPRAGARAHAATDGAAPDLAGARSRP